GPGRQQAGVVVSEGNAFAVGISAVGEPIVEVVRKSSDIAIGVGELGAVAVGIVSELDSALFRVEGLSQALEAVMSEGRRASGAISHAVQEGRATGTVDVALEASVGISDPRKLVEFGIVVCNGEPDRVGVGAHATDGIVSEQIQVLA